MTTERIHIRILLMAVAVSGLGLGLGPTTHADELVRGLTGSMQLDYLAVTTEDVARDRALDGATVELSLKMVVDHSERISSSVKVCVACHDMELGMAFFDIRLADELNLRIGRFTPAFGEFPLRHDPSNHRTSDKPLPYDMGRMLRVREWNMGVLPAPWVDNGIEVSGRHFTGDHQLDYAVYAVGGPRGDRNAVDFDFAQSRSSYYVDNNSQPSLGARLGATLGFTAASTASLGLSGMAGTYDPDGTLSYFIAGADLLLRMNRLLLRAEYLLRRTEMDMGDHPATRFRYGPDMEGSYANYFIKHGFYVEAEQPVGAFDLVFRWDGLRRAGNVLSTSPLRSVSTVLRYTGALGYRISTAVRIKASVEVYDFSDFEDEVTVHLGIAGPF